jgi:hypothetical protein
MTTFLRICLLGFAACAALGIVPPSILAARARRPGPAMTTLAAAAFVIYVLITAAERLPPA